MGGKCDLSICSERYGVNAHVLSVMMNLFAASLFAATLTLGFSFEIIWDDDTYAQKTVQSYDQNGDNLLTRDEMVTSLRNNAKKWAKIDMIVGDTDASGYIDFDEFANWFTKAGDQFSVKLYLDLYGSG